MERHFNQPSTVLWEGIPLKWLVVHAYHEIPDFLQTLQSKDVISDFITTSLLHFDIYIRTESKFEWIQDTTIALVNIYIWNRNNNNRTTIIKIIH